MISRPGTNIYFFSKTNFPFSVEKEEPDRVSRPKQRKISQLSRFNESKSTVVVRVPNKSVEDLLEPDAHGALGHDVTDVTPLSPVITDVNPLSPVSGCLNFPDLSEVLGALPDPPSTPPSTPIDLELDLRDGEPPGASHKNSNLFTNMFGAIKDLSVSNIHAEEEDKTKDFLNKDLAHIFSQWDLGESGKKPTSSAQDFFSEQKTFNPSSDGSLCRRDKKGGKSVTGKYSHKHKPKKLKIAVAEECVLPQKKSNLQKSESRVKNSNCSGAEAAISAPGDNSVSEGTRGCTDSLDYEGIDVTLKYEGSGGTLGNDDVCVGQTDSSLEPRLDGSALQEIAEDLRQMTEDVDRELELVDRGIEELSLRQSHTQHACHTPTNLDQTNNGAAEICEATVSPINDTTLTEPNDTMTQPNDTMTEPNDTTTGEIHDLGTADDLHSPRFTSDRCGCPLGDFDERTSESHDDLYIGAYSSETAQCLDNVDREHTSNVHVEHDHNSLEKTDIKYKSLEVRTINQDKPFEDNRIKYSLTRNFSYLDSAPCLDLDSCKDFDAEQRCCSDDVNSVGDVRSEVDGTTFCVDSQTDGELSSRHSGELFSHDGGVNTSQFEETELDGERRKTLTLDGCALNTERCSEDGDSDDESVYV